jgi:hypothetical protein
VKIQSIGCVIVHDGDEKRTSMCEFEPEHFEELTEPSSLLPCVFLLASALFYF